MATAKSNGKAVLIIRRKNTDYPETEQQKKVRFIAQYCGFYKGMKMEDVVDKMVNCVPQAWKDMKEGRISPPLDEKTVDSAPV